MRHHPRRFGESKYGLSRIYKVLLDLMVIKTIASDPTAANFITAANAMTNVPTLGGKLPSGLSFEKPQGLYPRQFNNTFWGNLKITATHVDNAKGATFLPVPAIG